MVGYFGPSLIGNGPGQVISYDDWNIVQESCIGDVKDVSAKELVAQQVFGVAGSLFISICALAKIIWLGLQRQHKGSRLVQWAHVHQTSMEPKLSILLFIVLPGFAISQKLYLAALLSTPPIASNDFIKFPLLYSPTDSPPRPFSIRSLVLHPHIEFNTMAQVGQSKGFSPKEAPKLNPPKSTPISLPHLAKCDGTVTRDMNLHHMAIMGTVFDVSGNTAYAPDGAYHIFAGKDASRALALSSLKAEDCRPEWEDLPDKEKQVLNDWFTFFSKRYNIVGQIRR
ncbi:MAG: hypothetical protein Q9181_003905 [Wetmoreana brouardii]